MNAIYIICIKMTAITETLECYMYKDDSYNKLLNAIYNGCCVTIVIGTLKLKRYM